MKTVSNQKIATINKEKVERGAGRKNPYIAVYVSTLEKAAKELKGNEFKVYMYFLSNENDFTFGISPKDIADRYGMSMDTAREGVRSLAKKGYLVEESSNTYTFYDDNKRKPINLPPELAKKLEKKVFINHQTGEKVEYTYQQVLDMVEDEEYANQIWEGR